MAVNGAAAVPLGRWVDRHGARWVMSGGSVLGAASVVAWSQAQTLPQLYLAFVGVGLAGAAVLYEPAFAVINTWFRQDRHAALLLAAERAHHDADQRGQPLSRGAGSP